MGQMKAGGPSVDGVSCSMWASWAEGSMQYDSMTLWLCLSVKASINWGVNVIELWNYRVVRH